MTLREWLMQMGEMIAWAVCEALGILGIPMLTRHGREEWGYADQWWHVKVHAPLDRPKPTTITTAGPSNLIKINFRDI